MPYWIFFNTVHQVPTSVTVNFLLLLAWWKTYHHSVTILDCKKICTGQIVLKLISRIHRNFTVHFDKYTYNSKTVILVHLSKVILDVKPGNVKTLVFCHEVW
jgi:hypothetical protein